MRVYHVFFFAIWIPDQRFLKWIRPNDTDPTGCTIFSGDYTLTEKELSSGKRNLNFVTKSRDVKKIWNNKKKKKK